MTFREADKLFEEFAKECRIPDGGFVDMVREKRKIGQEEYGTASYDWDPKRLKAEIVEELVDVMGWAAILHAKSSGIEDRLTALRVSRKAATLYQELLP